MYFDEIKEVTLACDTTPCESGTVVWHKTSKGEQPESEGGGGGLSEEARWKPLDLGDRSSRIFQTLEQKGHIHNNNLLMLHPDSLIKFSVYNYVYREGILPPHPHENNITHLISSALKKDQKRSFIIEWQSQSIKKHEKPK